MGYRAQAQTRNLARPLLSGSDVLRAVSALESFASVVVEWHSHCNVVTTKAT